MAEVLFAVAHPCNPLLMGVRPYNNRYSVREISDNISNKEPQRMSVMQALNEGHVTEDQVKDMESNDIIEIDFDDGVQKSEYRIVQNKLRRGRYRIMRVEIAMAIEHPGTYLGNHRFNDMIKYYKQIRDENHSTIPILFILFLTLREQDENYVMTRAVMKVVQNLGNSQYEVAYKGKNYFLELDNEVLKQVKRHDFVLYVPSNIRLYNANGNFVL